MSSSPLEIESHAAMVRIYWRQRSFPVRVRHDAPAAIADDQDIRPTLEELHAKADKAVAEGRLTKQEADDLKALWA